MPLRPGWDNHAPMSLKIEFPESLPVSGKRDEIARALAENQVVIAVSYTHLTLPTSDLV